MALGDHEGLAAGARLVAAVPAAAVEEHDGGLDRLGPEPPIWTQQRRKYAYQHEASRVEGHAIWHSSHGVGGSERDNRVKMMSKSLYLSPTERLSTGVCTSS